MDVTFDDDLSEINQLLDGQKNLMAACTPRRGAPQPVNDRIDAVTSTADQESVVSEATKKRLAKMSRIFEDRGEEIESPLPPSRGREIIEKENLLPELRPHPTEEGDDDPYTTGRKKRFAYLAEEYREREDDEEHLGHHEYRTYASTGLSASSPRKDLPAKKPPRKSLTSSSPSKPTPSTSGTSRPVGGEEVRKINWDPKVIDKLESQGFKKTTSQSRLQYEFDEARRKEEEARNGAEQLVVVEETIESTQTVTAVGGNVNVSSMAKKFGAFDSVGVPPYPPPPPPPKITAPKSVQTAVPPKPTNFPPKPTVPAPKPDEPTPTGETKSVLSMIRNFEGKNDAPPVPKVDPAVLPLSSKVKLFEKAQADQNKVAKKPKSSSSLKPAPAPPKPPRDPAVLAPRIAPERVEQPVAPKPQFVPEPPRVEELAAPDASAAGPNTVHAQRMLFENVQDNWKSNEIAQKTFEEKRRDMEIVLSRWQRPAEVRVSEPRAAVATENAQPGWQRTIQPQPKPVPISFEGIPPPPPPPPPPAKHFVNPPPVAPKPVYNPAVIHDDPSVDQIESAPVDEPSSSLEDTLTEVEEEEQPVVEEKQQYRVRFAEDRMYPSLDEFKAPAPYQPASSSRRITDQGEESDTEMTESEASFAVQPTSSRMARHMSYQMAMRREEQEFTDETTDTETYSEWDRESITSESTVTTSGAEYNTRYQSYHGQRMDTDSDLTSLSSFNASSPVKRSPPGSPERDSQVKRVRLNDPRTEHLENSPGQASLKYTLSTYRRQRPEVSLTPNSKKIEYQYRPPPIEESPEVESPNTVRVQAQLAKKSMALRIKELDFEAGTQLSIMHQASNAVNVCASRQEFKLSAERIEAEKLLLISTKKHAAIAEEIQRLKAELEKLEKSDDTKLPVATKGAISLSGLSLHLKPEFIEYMCGEGSEFVHHFIILIRHRETVIPSQLMSLSSLHKVKHGCLVFDNVINVQDLDQDFSLQIEVHGLQTKRENIEHDVKYHIKKQEKNKLRLTPKKSNHDKDSMKTPPTVRGGVSPAIGPSGGPAIRKLCFGLVGEATLTLSNVKTNKLTLAKVPGLSPLSGILSLNIHCASQSNIEASGFLTVFEDVSGLGCWQRRWYVLKGSYLSFWKYPDQQAKNEVAMGSIDLSECINEDFRPLRRDLCARMNSFALVVSKPYEPIHKDGLTMFCRGEKTLIRYMFAADSKEEMNVWCKQLKRTLGDIRAWNPDAQPPRPNLCEELNGV